MLAGSRIAAVGPRERTWVPEGARVVDGQGGREARAQAGGRDGAVHVADIRSALREVLASD